MFKLLMMFKLLLSFSCMGLFASQAFCSSAEVGMGELKRNDGPTVVMWDLLAKMDYKKGIIPPELMNLSLSTVKIPGYIIPFEDDSKSVTEFLLVPYPQACIHVPPPPANQMVWVKMQPGKETEYFPWPVWVEGVLSLESKEHAYGKASFSMQGQSVVRYQQ